MMVKLNTNNITYEVEIRCNVCRCKECLSYIDISTVKCNSCGNVVHINEISDLFGWIVDVIKMY